MKCHSLFSEKKKINLSSAESTQLLHTTIENAVFYHLAVNFAFENTKYTFIGGKGCDSCQNCFASVLKRCLLEKERKLLPFWIYFKKG